MSANFALTSATANQTSIADESFLCNRSFALFSAGPPPLPLLMTTQTMTPITSGVCPAAIPGPAM